MKRQSADTRKRRDELTSDVRHIAEEIRPLTDSVDSLHLLLQHVWQNREEFSKLLNGAAERTTIRCERCSGNCGLADAVTDRWKELRKDNGKFWGICPPCHAAVETEREVLPAETLFCTYCDATSATSLAAALRSGWQCIIDDEGNERGNYAGMCPACIDEEENAGGREADTEPSTAAEKPTGQKTLF